MKRCNNSWSILAMFFALAMLFCLGNIQGNPVDKPCHNVEYISDQSPPVFVIVTGSEMPNLQIERGVSVPILELSKAESVKNERISTPILYITSIEKNMDYASDLGLRSASLTSNPKTSDKVDTTVNNFRAREKV